MRYLQIASGSAAETENHLLIASDLGYLTTEVRERFLGDPKSVQRLIANLP